MSLLTPFKEGLIVTEHLYRRLNARLHRLKVCNRNQPYAHFMYVSNVGVHHDVIKWKHFPRYWPFVRRIHRLPVTSDAELWCFLWSMHWTNGWVNNREADDLGRHRAYFDVIVMRWCWKYTKVLITSSKFPSFNSCPFGNSQSNLMPDALQHIMPNETHFAPKSAELTSPVRISICPYEIGAEAKWNIEPNWTMRLFF